MQTSHVMEDTPKFDSSLWRTEKSWDLGLNWSKEINSTLRRMGNEVVKWINPKIRNTIIIFSEIII